MMPQNLLSRSRPPAAAEQQRKAGLGVCFTAVSYLFFKHLLLATAVRPII